MSYESEHDTRLLELMRQEAKAYVETARHPISDDPEEDTAM